MVVTKGPLTGVAQLERVIESVKYTLFCLSVVSCVFGLMLLVVTVWMKWENTFQDWIDYLDIWEYNIGLWVLIFASFLMILTAVFNAGASLVEFPMALFVSTGLHGACFVLGLAGCIVLAIFSSHGSAIQPLIWNSMRNLIFTSHNDYSARTVKLLQESIGCCGADGPNDWSELLKPLPSECRDSVTGNSFYYGCVDQLSWYLEDRSYWVIGLALFLCALNVIQGVLSLVLYQGIKKEEQSTNSTYNR